MRISLPNLAKVRFVINVVTVYAVTGFFLWNVAHPTILFPSKPVVVAIAPPKLEPNVLTGNPKRVVIPKYNIDLEIHPGVYNSADHTWTLTGYDAQYATPSIPPNDKQGTTLVYGHNNKYVFGPLNHTTPAAGDVAQIITDNGRSFLYTFQDVEDVKPDNMTVFQYAGKPTLTIQTCSGNWNEWRRLYRFRFERVE